jgi:hypothetical protein
MTPPSRLTVGVVLLAVLCAAHHYASNRLIWLYDIHLLANGMDDGQLRQLVARATSKGVRAVTAEAITAAGERFDVPVPPALVESPSGRAEATASFLEPGRTKVDILREDLRALPGRWDASAAACDRQHERGPK